MTLNIHETYFLNEKEEDDEDFDDIEEDPYDKLGYGGWDKIFPMKTISTFTDTNE